jgi:glycine/D-amino acid oxidase-like deaminating enzyme
MPGHQEAVRPPSFWLDTVPGSLVPRPPLSGAHRADVAVIGAGFTGLWTAYYLSELRPGARIVVLEADVAGFGAAGRNGGWCTSHLTGIDAWLSGPRAEQARALQRGMFDAIDEIGRVCAREGVDCDYAKAGFLNFATNEHEARRTRALVERFHARGFADSDYRWLDAAETEAKVRIRGLVGALFSPHGAALQPAKLARGLAEVVERRGVTIHEQSPVRSLGENRVATDAGSLQADVVLVCTEGTTQHLRAVRRKLMPLHSMMIVTEPLPDPVWREIGAADRVLFGDTRRILSYAQRTGDGRIALGAGGRYVYGSRVIRYFPPEGPDFALAEQVLTEFFPMLRDVRITHRWGGAFGVTRNSQPFVRFDPERRTGAAGGYTGNGVSAANLAGRTLAELAAGARSQRTEYPWVQHASPSWEPEPLRWLAVTSILKIGRAADVSEIGGKRSRLGGRLFDAFAAH